MLLDLCPFGRVFEQKSLAPRTTRPRLTSGERLVRAVTELAGPHAQLERHAEVPWASVTFSGARHTVVMRFTGWEACDDAERIIATLPEHDFTIPGVLVADATVAGISQDLLPQPVMVIELELLLLDDC